MAEQNRKTEHQKEVRDRSKMYVDLFLKVLFAAEVDAGWGGPTVIGRLMDFLGELPESSGFSGVDRMPERIRFIQTWPKQFRVAHRLLMHISRAQREAVCVDRAYRGAYRMTTDPLTNTRSEIYWSDTKCAEELNINANTLRSRISDGYKALDGIVGPAIEMMQKAAA